MQVLHEEWNELLQSEWDLPERLLRGLRRVERNLLRRSMYRLLDGLLGINRGIKLQGLRRRKPTLLQQL
jgi:hypothetical protein